MRILLILCGLSWLIGCGHTSETGSDPNAQDRPNIIIIMADDLGYGDLACYGNNRIQTPHLDYLASQGIQFTNFHSNGVVCSPTRASLMTGKYPHRTGISGVVTARNHRHVGMALEEVTIADYLMEREYRTGIVGKWHLGYDTAFSPLNQGFETFKGFVSGNVDYHSHYDQENIFDWWEDKKPLDEEGYITDLITERAVSFIQQHKDDPFFLYVAHAAPHYPYQGRKSPALRGPGTKGRLLSGPDADVSTLYAEMIEAMDDGVGKILETLGTLNLTNQTIIFFLSDNGANERGSNHPYKGQKGQVWEGGHRVPAMCYWGENMTPAVRSDLVMSMDIFPTIISLTDPDHEALNDLDGRSFHTLLQGDSENLIDTRNVFWKTRNSAAVRNGAMKLVRHDGQFYLYNLDEDAEESHNLMGELPELFENLKEDLKRWEDEMNRYPTIS